MTALSSHERLEDYLGRPLEFRDHGACNRLEDKNIMFPVDGPGVIAAKQICASCVVQEECLDYAVTKPEPFGVRGGMSERQRRPLRKQYMAKKALEVTTEQ